VSASAAQSQADSSNDPTAYSHGWLACSPCESRVISLRIFRVARWVVAGPALVLMAVGIALIALCDLIDDALEERADA
jgi:hypothetical protein